VGVLRGPTPVSIIIVAFESASHLRSLLDSLAGDEQGADEVIVVDNASTDGSAAIAEAAGATVIRLLTNEGFPKACHVGAAEARNDTLVFLNPDTEPRAGWLPPLLAALALPGVGAACPTLELAEKPGHFNTSGGALTYYGIAWATDVGAAVDGRRDPVETAFPTGAAMAVTAATWRDLGGYRPDFFLYHEDSDFGWRLRLRGLRSVRVPASVVAHTYDYARHPEKMFFLERNRLMMLRANYRPATLALLAPVLFFVELGVLIIAVRDGWAGAKFRSWVAAWRARKATRAWRQSIVRSVGDGEILATMQSAPVGVAQVGVPAARLVGWLLGAYQRFVRRFV
jgi:GT2 family glycosyltransferase